MDPSLLQALEWRNVGPHRGGRVTAVEGVVEQPFTFYMGATGGGVWKTTDGGANWSNISDGWFKTGSVGAIAVAPSDPNVIYAGMGEHCVRGVTTSHGDGVYKSTDGGKTWQQVNSLHVMTERSAYYMHIFADPNDRETVYVLNSPMFKSTDGGKTYDRIATPHGDNHDLWINPRNSNWMVQSNDGGANVSYDAGKSWSTQDNSTVKIKSRDFDSGIGWTDWYAIGGGESAHVAFDAGDPVLVYAGAYQGQITEFDDRTGMARNIMRYPQRTAFRPASGYPYRFNWNAPILVSQHDPKIIYHAANVLLQSTDRGQHWTEISPDLTRNEPRKQGVVEGEFTFEGTGGEMYNTIFYIAESPHQRGENLGRNRRWPGASDPRRRQKLDGDYAARPGRATDQHDRSLPAPAGHGLCRRNRLQVG